MQEKGGSNCRREHAGGQPHTMRSHDQWVSATDFPWEVVDGFGHDEPPTYPIEKFSDALKQIAMWILNDGKFQERGIRDRAAIFAFMIAPSAIGCSTQAELADKMKLSRTQVNEYVKQFVDRFGFVCGATYTDRQTVNRNN